MTQRVLFVNARQVVTCAGPARGRRGSEMADAVVRTDVAANTLEAVLLLNPRHDVAKKVLQWVHEEQREAGNPASAPGP